MKIASTRRLRIAILSAAASVLLLAACSGIFKSNLPISQVYVLRPTWPAPTAAASVAPTIIWYLVRRGCNTFLSFLSVK